MSAAAAAPGDAGRLKRVGIPAAALLGLLLMVILAVIPRPWTLSCCLSTPPGVEHGRRPPAPAAS
jgi:hypothetical protein